MKLSTTETHQKGTVLFKEGDLADQFYILLKGRVKLSLGKIGQSVYLASNAGEAFGWSSLTGRDTYSASAECLSLTKLLKIDKKPLQKIIEKDTSNGLILFKRLAELLGDRLIQSYTIISSAFATEPSTSFGTGQVMTTTEAEQEK
jgi:CRP-like cAMP-binding protein